MTITTPTFIDRAMNYFFRTETSLTEEQRAERTQHNEKALFVNLPPDVMRMICAYLDNNSVGKLLETCKTLNITVNADCYYILRIRMATIVSRAAIYHLRSSDEQQLLRSHACRSAMALRNRRITAERQAMRAQEIASRPDERQLATLHEVAQIISTVVNIDLSTPAYILSGCSIAGFRGPPPGHQLPTMVTDPFIQWD